MDARQQRLAEAVARFEGAWAEGHPVPARDFAAGHLDLAPHLLRELVGVEFACLWHAGQGVPVEVQLRNYPEFKGDHEVVFNLLWTELLDAPGEPDEAKYLERFPDLTNQIRDMFLLYRAMGPESFRDWSRGATRLSNLDREGNAWSGPFTLEQKERPTLAPGNEPAPETPTLHLLESYRLGKLIGEGGFKEVFRATQLSTQRDVALKRPRASYAADLAAVSAFVGEGRTQAILNHQNIPAIFLLDPGQGLSPVLVERLIEGAEWKKSLGDKSLQDNLKILQRVGQALAYAHTRHRIIHRDLKPQNVVLGDAFDEVYVVDWGLALHVAEQPDPQCPAPHRSRESGVAGTPSYMAPEMANGKPVSCTPATDVFLLGGLLYEILTRTPPHLGHWKLALIRACQPVRERPEERAPDRSIPAELSRIAMKALAFDPADRYPDGGAFCDALDGYLRHAAAEEQCGQAARLLEDTRQQSQQLEKAGRPLHPVVNRLLEVAGVFHQAAVSWHGNSQAPGKVVAPLVEEAGYRKALAGERDARWDLVRLGEQTGDFATVEAQLDLLEALPETPREPLDEARTRVRAAATRRRRLKLWLRTAVAAAACLLLGLTGVGYALMEKSRQATQAEADRFQEEAKRKDEELKVHEEKRQKELARQETREEQEKRRRSEAVQRALPLVGRADVDRSVRFYSGEALHLAEGMSELQDNEEAKNALATRWMEARQLGLVPTHTSTRRVHTGNLIYSPAGKYLASQDLWSGPIRVWDTASGEQVRVLEGHAVPDKEIPPAWATARAFAFLGETPPRLLSAGLDGTVRLWDFLRDTELAKFPLGQATAEKAYLALAVSPPAAGDTVRFVTGDEAGRLRQWTVQEQAQPDGSQSRLSLHVGNERSDAHRGPVYVVRYHPDGSQYASTGSDGVVRLWDASVAPLAELTLPDRKPGDTSLELLDLAYDPAGRELAAAGSDGTIYVWDVVARRLKHRLQGHEPGLQGRRSVKSLAYVTPNRLWSGGFDGTVREWDTATGKQVEPIRGRHLPHTIVPENRLVRALAACPGGAEVATCGADGAIRLWDARNGKAIGHLEGPLYSATRSGLFTPDSAFSAKSNLLITASSVEDAFLRSWDTKTLRERKTYTGLPPLKPEDRAFRVSALAVHPDGGQFVSAEPNGALLFWDVDAEKPRLTVNAHTFPRFPVDLAKEMELNDYSSFAVTALAWSQQGDRVASAGFDGQIKVWDAQSGQLVVHFVSEDANVLPTALGYESIPKTWQEPMKKIAATPYKLVFDPQGNHLIGAGGDRVIRVWNLQSKAIVDRLQGHGSRVATLALSHDGTCLASGADDGTVVVWNVKAKLPLRTLSLKPLLVKPTRPVKGVFQRYQGGVNSLSFSPNLRLLAVALGDGTIAVYDLPGGELVGQSAGHEPDRRGLAAPSVHFTRELSGINLNAYLTILLQNQPFTAATYSSYFLKVLNDTRLVSSGRDGTVRLWDLQPLSSGVRFLDGTWGARRVAVLGDGSQYIAVGSPRRLLRWDKSGTVLSSELTVDERDFPAAVAAVPNSNKFVLGTQRGQVLVMDGQTGKIIVRFKGKDGKPEITDDGDSKVTAVAVSQDGTLAASSWPDGSVDVWRIADGQWVQRVRRSRLPVCTVAFRPGNQQLATMDESDPLGDERGALALWELSTGRLLHTLQGPSQTPLSTALAYSPDGSRLVQGGHGRDAAIIVWEPDTGKQLQTFHEHLPVTVGELGNNAVIVNAVAFTPDGRRMATCGRDGTVRLWDVTDPKNYKPVLTLSTNRLSSWHANQKTHPNSPFPSVIHKEETLCAAFSPDNRQLLVGGWDPPVRVFNLDTIEKDLQRVARDLLGETERLAGLRRQGTALAPFQINRLVRQPIPSP